MIDSKSMVRRARGMFVVAAAVACALMAGGVAAEEAEFDHDPLWVSAPAEGGMPGPSIPIPEPPARRRHRSRATPRQQLAATQQGEDGGGQAGTGGDEDEAPFASTHPIKSCKGRDDYCANEAECCELDSCNIWQHAGRDLPVLLTLYASWCPLSRDFMLQYDILRKEYDPADRVLVAKANAEENPNLVADIDATEFPQLVLFAAGCYWTPGGCLDKSQHFIYNGTTNEAEEIRVWTEDTLLFIRNTLSSSAIPIPCDGPCKVDSMISPPTDMKETYVFPRDQGKGLLPATVEHPFGKAPDAPPVPPPSDLTLTDHPDERQASEMAPKLLGDYEDYPGGLPPTPEQPPLRGS